MTPLHVAHEIRASLAAKANGTASFNEKDISTRLKSLPSAIRRMGIVRCLQWLQAGRTHVGLGQALFQQLAPHLELPLTIDEAARTLESGSRTQVFRAQQRAVALFDALATIDRIESKA